MITGRVVFDDIPFMVPVLPYTGELLEFPAKDFDAFPPFCGSGDIMTLLVPDTVYGLKISPACYVHDICFEIAEPTDEDFFKANMMFLQNLLSIIRSRTDWGLVRHLRNYRAMTYYDAVSRFGERIFWRIKKEQTNSY